MVLEIIIVILAFGALNHLFFDKELSFEYLFKNVIFPILIVLALCLIISLFSKNIYVITLPVWLMFITWSILGYIDYYQLIKKLIDRKMNK